MMKQNKQYTKNCNALNQSRSISSEVYQSSSPIRFRKTVREIRETGLFTDSTIITVMLKFACCTDY